LTAMNWLFFFSNYFNSARKVFAFQFEFQVFFFVHN
jgi:hypothetical protein